MSANRPIADKLKSVPLFRVLVPMMVGIILGAFLKIPLYVWITTAAACAVTAWFGRKQTLSMLYVHLAVLLFGAAMMTAQTPRAVIPQGERVWIELLITDNPVYGEDRSARTSAIAGRWRTDEGQWSRSGEKLMVIFDTTHRFAAGDRLVFSGYVNPVSDSADSYARLMMVRGYTGRTYISSYSHVVVSPVKDRRLATVFKNMQHGATERLGRLDMGGGELAVAAAMTTGDRSGVTPALRSSYARTGTIHLLSVSGVHVAMVFMLVNILFYLLPLFRRGHIARNLLAVALVWAYAAMTGLSPPVIRSAFMFTGAQAALAMSAHRSPVNIMCGTALIMLAIGPAMLFDISFQLSFIAVAGIMAWFGPLYRLVASRWKLLNALWATLITGLVASAATMPLVSHTFGMISLAGIILNPVVILTANIVLLSSLVWIIMPLPLLEPLFSRLIGGAAWFQNKIIELVAGVPAASVEYSMPLWLVFVIYAAMIIFTVWLAARPQTEKPLSLPR